MDEDSGLVTAIVNPDYPKNWGVVIRQIISQVKDEMGSRYNYDYLVSDRDGNHIVDPHEKINGFVKALQRKYKDLPPKFDVNQFMRVGDDWDLQQTVQVIIKVK